MLQLLEAELEAWGRAVAVGILSCVLASQGVGQRWQPGWGTEEGTETLRRERDSRERYRQNLRGTQRRAQVR